MRDDEVSAELLRHSFERAANSGRSEVIEGRFLTWLLGIISALLVAGIIGDVIMYATVKAQGQQIEDLDRVVTGLKTEVDILLQYRHADQSQR